MKCYFHEKGKNSFKCLSVFKFSSSTTIPQKSVNCGIIELFADEFLMSIRRQTSFQNLERKLKIYKETFKIYLGDAAKGKPYFPADLAEKVVSIHQAAPR